MCSVTGCVDICKYICTATWCAWCALQAYNVFNTVTPIAVYCCWLSATAHVQHTHFKLGSMERQSSVVFLVLMFLMLKGDYHCAADTVRLRCNYFSCNYNTDSNSDISDT